MLVSVGGRSDLRVDASASSTSAGMPSHQPDNPKIGLGPHDGKIEYTPMVEVKSCGIFAEYISERARA